MEPALTVRQVAEYLNVDTKVIYRLVHAGDLPGFKVAGTWRFKREDINAWIEAQKRRTPSEPVVTDDMSPGNACTAPKTSD
jgi:excisionase family DNA binding protein